MSDTNEAKKDAAPAAAAPAPAKGKGGGAAVVLGIVLPALLSAGGAFGGVKAAGHAPAGAAHAEPAPRHEPKPPGPTMPLDPFLVSVPDAAKKAHPLKLTVAIEFESTAKEEALKPFMPRIRDAILTHMRTLTYEQAVDQEHAAKFREELLERVHKSGAVAAERILITDLVSQ